MLTEVLRQKITFHDLCCFLHLAVNAFKLQFFTLIIGCNYIKNFVVHDVGPHLTQYPYPAYAV